MAYVSFCSSRGRPCRLTTAHRCGGGAGGGRDAAPPRRRRAKAAVSRISCSPSLPSHRCGARSPAAGGLCAGRPPPPLATLAPPLDRVPCGYYRRSHSWQRPNPCWRGRSSVVFTNAAKTREREQKRGRPERAACTPSPCHRVLGEHVAGRTARVLTAACRTEVIAGHVVTPAARPGGRGLSLDASTRLLCWIPERGSHRAHTVVTTYVRPRSSAGRRGKPNSLPSVLGYLAPLHAPLTSALLAPAPSAPAPAGAHSSPSGRTPVPPPYGKCRIEKARHPKSGPISFAHLLL